MRTMLKLIVSLAFAAGICGVLISNGLIRFGQAPEKDYTVLTEPADPIAGQLTMDAGKPMVVDDNPPVTSAEEPDAADVDVSEKPPADAPVKIIAGPSGDITIPDDQDRLKTNAATGPEKRDSTGMDGSTFYVPIDTDVYQQMLAYLYFLEKDRGGNVERRFSQFLKTEFDFYDDRIDQVLQMAFWKNFFVFQETWAPGDASLLQEAFDRELALKKAGFGAKSIQLMGAEITAAESRLSEMLQEIEALPEKRNTSVEGMP